MDWKFEADGGTTVVGKVRVPKIEPTAIELFTGVGLRVVGNGSAERGKFFVAVKEDAAATEQVCDRAYVTKLPVDPAVPVIARQVFVDVANERVCCEVGALEALDDLHIDLSVLRHCRRSAEVVGAVAEAL